MDTQLTGKVALVTGGSRGIGRAVALGLAARGAHVAICGRTAESLETTAAEIRAQGVQAWTYQADVSKLDDINAFTARAIAETDGFDILVNNAVTSTSARFDELTDDEFRYHIDVKLMAYIRIARLILPTMQKKSGGRIVNVAGMTARIVAPLRMTNGIVNAGVTNFTKQFSTYTAPHNVTVNAVHPGYTTTERVIQIFESEAKSTGQDYATVLAKKTEGIPLGKLIHPDDVAAAVLFFCAPEAAMITGQVIAVDGGSGNAITY